MEKEIITINGKKKVKLSPDAPDAIRKAIDRYIFYGLICRNNITLTANANATGIFSGRKQGVAGMSSAPENGCRRRFVRRKKDTGKRTAKV